MLTWLFNRNDSRRKASELYGAVVTLARRPQLYAGMGVADTPEGRYEALVLSLFLVLERLRREGDEATAHAQALIEAFVTDMDDNMREMGVGDLTVPKKVKKAAAALYDRADVYRAALGAEGNQELASVLTRLIPAADGRALDGEALAADVRDMSARLAGLPLTGILAGDLPA
jgi:cytochrome b pre-mRNA-processing protein 3